MTSIEIATIAAALHRQGESFDPERLVTLALTLAIRAELLLLQSTPPPKPPAPPAPKPAAVPPLQYPVPLPTFLRIVLPQVREADRYAKYRRFLREWLPGHQFACDILDTHIGDTPAKHETPEAHLKRRAKDGFSLDAFDLERERLAEWYAADISRVRAEAAKKRLRRK